VEQNLVPVCKNCHTEIETRAPFSESFSPELVGATATSCTPVWLKGAREIETPDAERHRRPPRRSAP
jgi:hypothetical protein